jgi:hypothetical protein
MPAAYSTRSKTRRSSSAGRMGTLKQLLSHGCGEQGGDASGEEGVVRRTSPKKCKVSSENWDTHPLLSALMVAFELQKRYCEYRSRRVGVGYPIYQLLPLPSQAELVK